MKNFLWYAAGIATAIIGKRYVWPKIEPSVTPVIEKAKEKISEITEKIKKESAASGSTNEPQAEEEVK